MRVGIIGTGFGGEVHAQLFNHHPKIEVVSIATVTGKNAEVIEKTTGIKNIYTDWQQMVTYEDLDLLSITTIPSQHKEMVLASFKKGIPVLCEKPLSIHARHTKEMWDIQRESGIPGFINFEWRFLSARLKVKELLEKGVIGNVIHVRYSVNVPMYLTSAPTRKSWLDKKEEGGMLGSMGSHMFDSLLWWMDSNIVTVNGHLKNLYPSYVDENGQTQEKTSDDLFMAIGSFENGATFNLEFLQSAYHGSQWRLEIYGTEGNIIMDEDKYVKMCQRDGPYVNIPLSPLPNSQPPELIQGKLARYFEAFYPLIEQLYENLSENKVTPYLPTFACGHKVQTVMDAVRESSEKGCSISLDKVIL